MTNSKHCYTRALGQRCVWFHFISTVFVFGMRVYEIVSCKASLCLMEKNCEILSDASLSTVEIRNCTKYLVTSVICIVSLYQFCKFYPLIFESAEICCSVTALINVLVEIMWPWHCGHVVIVPELLATTHPFFFLFFFLLELSGVWLSKSTPQNLDTGYVAWSTLSGPRVRFFVPINREIPRSSAQRRGWQQRVVRVVAKVLLCIESEPQLRQFWDKMGGDIEPG